MQTNKQTNKAFTLIELSIVVVIIGLIVAGVVAGQSLVNQAKLKDSINDLSKYKIAYNTFKLTYNAIPGDMANASSYWSGADNGNNNKLVDTGTEEDYEAWHHLSQSSLITENYSGTGAPSVIGSNVPGIGLNAQAQIRLYYTASAGNYGKAGNILHISTPVFQGIIAAAEAYSIDQKIDDSLASEGSFRAVRPTGGPNVCVSALWNATSADYYLNETSATNCRLNYLLD